MVGGRSATAANAGTPHFEATSEVTTTHQAGFVAGAVILLHFLVLEVIIIEIIYQLMLLHDINIRMIIVAMKKIRYQA